MWPYQTCNAVLDRGSVTFLTAKDLPELPASCKLNSLESQLDPQSGIRQTLLKLYTWQYLYSGVYRLLADALALTGPLLLHQISSATSGSKRTLLIAFFGFAMVCQTLAVNAHLERTANIGFKVKATLRSLIFQKSLALSLKARRSNPAGKIIAMHDVDTSRIDMSIGSAHMIYAAPMSILASAGLLFYYVGWSGLLGLLVLASYVRLQTFAMSLLASQRKSASTLTDSRVSTIQEAITGMKAIRFLSMQETFIRKISSFRESELTHVTLYLLWKASIAGFTQIVPVFALFATLYFSSRIETSAVFTAMAILYNLRVPLILLPQVLSQATDAWISFNKIEAFLAEPEVTPRYVTNSNDSESKIVYNKCRFSYDVDEGSDRVSPSETFTLIVDFVLPIRPSLIFVVGATGAGKSSLLAAIAGEMMRESGHVEQTRTISIGYSVSPPWIKGGSIKENIVFDQGVDENRLREILDAVALTEEIALMPDGLDTKLGEGGLGLSGGQKVRVQLARTMYDDADLLLLDDALGSLDPPTARHIVTRAFKHFLVDKTIVVTTHNLELLPLADRIIVVSNGRVVQDGHYGDLADIEFTSALFLPDLKLGTSRQDNEESVVRGKILDGPRGLKGEQSQQRVIVSQQTLSFYLSMAGGLRSVFLVLSTVTLTQLLRLATDDWLRNWARDAVPKYFVGSAGLLVYLMMGIFQTVSVVLQGAVVAFAGSSAARRIHASSVSSVFRSSMKFFEEESVGSIVTRFSKDVDDMDNFLPETIRITGFTISLVLANLLNVALRYPLYLAVLIPSMTCGYFAQNKFRKTSKQLKRLENTSLSSVNSFLVECHSGATVLRHHKQIDNVTMKFRSQLDSLNVAPFIFFHLQRWLSVRLEVIAAALIVTSALVTSHDSTSGLQVMQITASLTWFVRQLSETERLLISVERLRLLSMLRSEHDELRVGISEKLSDMPDLSEIKGNITLRDVTVRYEGRKELALDRVSITISAGEKVALCGRTASGKSTLTAVLVGMEAPMEGYIKLDAWDITMLDPLLLRSLIVVIPQDPVIFSGTIREWIIPPNKQLLDKEIRNILTKVGFDCSLDFNTKGGRGLSTGEHRLLSLARAVAIGAKVLILDEVSSSTDHKTEEVILKFLKQLVGVTVIVVTHRPQTVMQYCERIIQLEDGKVVL